MKTILSDVVSRFSRQTENICSESLVLIINESPILKDLFREYIKELSKCKIQLSELSNLRSQVSSQKDQSIPDIEIPGKNGNYLLIEVKFWAGLTEHQPETYLSRINANGGGGLVFLCPDLRVASLINEVRRRLPSGFEIINDNLINIDENKQIIFIGWTTLIQRFWKVIYPSKEEETLFNLYQLKSVIEKMDTTGFIPIQPALFTPLVGVQRDQLIDLLDKIVDKLDKLETSGLSYGGGRYSFMRFFKIKYANHHIPGLLLYSSELWRQYGDTPLYFCLYHNNWAAKNSNLVIEIPVIEDIFEKLNKSNFELIRNAQFKGNDNGNNPISVIPLNVKTNVDQDSEYEFIKNQVEQILNVIEGEKRALD